MKHYNIAVVPLDGVNRQVIPLAVETLKKAQQLIGGYEMEFKFYEAGVEYAAKTGKPHENGFREAVSEADAILAGSCGHFDPEMAKTSYPAFKIGFIPKFFRRGLGNAIGVRPLRLLRGIDSPLKDLKPFDIMLVRQLTEGNYMTAGSIVSDTAAYDVQLVTRPTTEQFARYSFELAQKRNGRTSDGKKMVSLLNKHGRIKSTDFYRQIFKEVGQEYPDVTLQYVEVDALCVQLIKDPASLDVIACENAYGDIVGDIGALISGGMGIAPTADIGGITPQFRPNHGTFPRANGKNFASPFAAIHTAALMLDILGDDNSDENLKKASRLIISALEYNFMDKNGAKTKDFGGTAGTNEAAAAVLKAMEVIS